MTVKFHSKAPAGWGIHSKVEPFQFPGGEWHLKLPDNEIPHFAHVINDRNIMDDLIQVALWADWCRSVDARVIIKVPYLPAARADRNTPFGGKVYADMINAIGADEVIVFDPHSPIVPALVNNVKIVDSARVIKNSVFGKSGYTDYTGIIAPDEGAKDRAKRVAQMMNMPVYEARKVRDFETGRILKYDPYEVADAPKDGRYLVVDDICDGGGTFKLLAENVGLHREQLGLWVSHGIFSGKAHELNDYYGRIYTTDSVKPINDIGALTVPLGSYLNDLYFSNRKEIS